MAITPGGPYNLDEDVNDGDPGQLQWARDSAAATNDLDLRASALEGAVVVEYAHHAEVDAVRRAEVGVLRAAGTWLEIQAAFGPLADAAFVADASTVGLEAVIVSNFADFTPLGYAMTVQTAYVRSRALRRQVYSYPPPDEDTPYLEDWVDVTVPIPYTAGTLMGVSLVGGKPLWAPVAPSGGGGGGGGGVAGVATPLAGEYQVGYSHTGTTVNGSSSQVSGLVPAYLIYVPTEMTIDALAFRVGVAQAGINARAMLYSLAANMRTLTLIASGTADCSTTGNKVVTITPQVIGAGWYAAMVRPDPAATTVRFISHPQSGLTGVATTLAAATAGNPSMAFDPGPYASPTNTPTAEFSAQTNPRNMVALRRSA